MLQRQIWSQLWADLSGGIWQVKAGGVVANRDWGSFLLDDGTGPERNWLV